MLEGLECGSVVASRGKGGETGLAVVLVRPARESKFAIAVVAALVLHLVAFGAMVGTTMVDILIAEDIDVFWGYDEGGFFIFDALGKIICL